MRNMALTQYFSTWITQPFSRGRDDTITGRCHDAGIDVVSYHDSLLHEPGTVLTNDGMPYKVFSQFFRKASKMEISLPVMQVVGKFYSGGIGLEQLDLSELSSHYRNDLLFTKGGRSYALSILQELWEFANYDDERDYPSIQGTTGLSAHNKFGTISIREFYHYVADEFGTDHTLINELHWRDFFTHIAIAFPHVFKHAFKQKFDALSWSDDRGAF